MWARHEAEAGLLLCHHSVSVGGLRVFNASCSGCLLLSARRAAASSAGCGLPWLPSPWCAAWLGRADYAEEAAAPGASVLVVRYGSVRLA